MYIFAYFLLLVITLLFGKIIYKSFLNPITIWSSWWCVVGIMANLALFDYYRPSNYVNIVIISGIIVFFFCATIYGLKKKDLWLIQQKKDKIDEYFRYDLFFTINIVAIIIEVPYFLKALNTLSAHAFKMVYLRGVLTDADEGIVSGGFLSILRDSGIKNVFILSALYASIIIFTNAPKKRKRQVVTLALIETFEYSITNAARTYIVGFFFYLLFAMLFFKRHSVLKAIRKNKIIVSIIAILIIALLIMQNSRASDMSILETVYIYYFSGPSYLSRLIEDNSVGLVIGSDLYWGTFTFGFIANIYYYIKIALVGINDSTVKLLASVISNKQYLVGSHTYINAMCTCFYPFLADWGNSGIVIGPVITCILGCRYYGKMKQCMDIGSVAICIYVFYLLFFTVFKWNFLYIDFTVILVLNYFICPRPGQRIVWGKIKSNYNENKLE